MVYMLNEHVPVSCRMPPGNTPDSRGLSIILADLKNAGFKDAVMITDRGYESIRNLELYIDKGDHGNQDLAEACPEGDSQIRFL